MPSPLIGCTSNSKSKDSDVLLTRCESYQGVIMSASPLMDKERSPKAWCYPCVRDLLRPAAHTCLLSSWPKETLPSNEHTKTMGACSKVGVSSRTPAVHYTLVLLLGGEPQLHLYVSCAAKCQIYTEVRVAGPGQLHSHLQARKIQTKPVLVGMV